MSVDEKTRVPVIIPVEIQVRELDAKVLLACVAAHRGIPAVIGRIRNIHSGLPAFSRGVYLSKGMGPQSVRKFEFIRGLGHEITALDEEALVHYPPENHFMKRVSPDAGRFISHLFAWGPENEKLWRTAPQLRESMIHLTGNPRGDLLRKELLPYFENESKQLRDHHGDFILVNTNFPTVNSNRGIYKFEPDGAKNPGIGARDLTPEFALNLHRHRNAHFLRFQRMIPELARALPDARLVIRPHPSERPEIYHRMAHECSRVSVENEGNVLPWMLAARATIHNGCTTGVEARLMGVPTIAYGPLRDESYDFGCAFELPNRLSHSCPDMESLVETIRRILQGDASFALGDEREALMAEFFSSRSGPLASDRIVSVLSDVIQAMPDRRAPSLTARLDARRRNYAYRFERLAPRRLLTRLVRGKRRPPHARKTVYPAIPPDQMRERVDRFSDLLGYDGRLRIETLGPHVYRIES